MPGFQNPMVKQASAGLEWAWMPNTSVAVNYLHVRGNDLPRARDVNVGARVPTVLTVPDDGLSLPSLIGSIPDRSPASTV